MFVPEYPLTIRLLSKKCKKCKMFPVNDNRQRYRVSENFNERPKSRVVVGYELAESNGVLV